MFDELPVKYKIACRLCLGWLMNERRCELFDNMLHSRLVVGDIEHGIATYRDQIVEGGINEIHLDACNCDLLIK